jgi:hypothetical protein
MMRTGWAALAILLAGGPQDAARIQALVKQLDSADWVDQAKAAKELVSIGRPALTALSSVSSNESPAVRYWADTTSREIYRRTGGGGPSAPPTAPQEVALSVPATPGFSPGENDLGSVMFICNNSKHGDYECVLPLCRVCGKMKKFAYDYSAKCWRCTVCKREFPVSSMKCDQCGDPPGPRTRIRMKRN